MQTNNSWIWMLSIVTTLSGILCIDEKLIFSSSNSLKEIDLQTGTVKKFADINYTVESLAYDYKDNYLYVPRYAKGDILRFSYPSNASVTFATVVVSDSKIIGVAYDSLNAHLYWTEVDNGRIMRCKADGSELTNIRNETHPSVITIDTDDRLIFYGQEENNGHIHRMTVHGKEHSALIADTYTVHGIGLDVSNKRLYWMEHSVGLKSAWYNGSDVTTLVHSGYWNIAINRDFIFYISNNRILKIKKSVGEQPAIVYNETGPVYALLIYENKENDELSLVLYLAKPLTCMTVASNSIVLTTKQTDRK